MADYPITGKALNVERLHCQGCPGEQRCAVYDDDRTKRRCTACNWCSIALKKKQLTCEHVRGADEGAARCWGCGLLLDEERPSTVPITLAHDRTNQIATAITEQSAIKSMADAAAEIARLTGELEGERAEAARLGERIVSACDARSADLLSYVRNLPPPSGQVGEPQGFWHLDRMAMRVLQELFERAESRR